ncbi:MAG: BrnT family toxin [Ignavibacteriota bacterium]|nr:BrnT family toxin [Ignavibacteriales bacterium]MBL1123975.1 BrnT family toxin [Ignavibacteriota bacterium]MCE7857993.1 BrnT family toxin [Ignavibacteria bacterium CHB3]MEB2295319.1 BrnT family toxin [Ignavibacteria bacterium]NUM60673.1 BrnT family toxin [Ignavibacteriaceae bacterium]
MLNMRFVWDKNKNLANIKKHKISFEEAKTVFLDDNARLIHDPEHSISEERFIILGITNKLRLLVVVHTYKEDGDVIRIISARKATRTETIYYYKVK